jgi:hypothetical protein
MGAILAMSQPNIICIQYAVTVKESMFHDEIGKYQFQVGYSRDPSI